MEAKPGNIRQSSACLFIMFYFVETVNLHSGENICPLTNTADKIPFESICDPPLPPLPDPYPNSYFCNTQVQSSTQNFEFNMAASAAQTRVKEEVEKSIEKLEKGQLRGLQVS